MIKKIARINKKLPLKKETQIMRLRNVPGSREAIADSPLAINEPKELKGKWNEEFGNNNPIRIEIGIKYTATTDMLFLYIFPEYP